MYRIFVYLSYMINMNCIFSIDHRICIVIIGVGWEKISPGHTLFIFDNSITWMSILISIKISGIYDQIWFQLVKLSTKWTHGKNKY